MDTKILLPALALSLAVMSCRHSAQTETPTPETVDVAHPLVETITISSQYPGVLWANSEVNVVAKVNGQILSSNFTSGKEVKQGQVLYTIDSGSYRDQVNQAQASLTTAKSSLDYARAHYDAVKRAAESDAVSKMEVEQAHSALIQAEASVKNATAALETSRRYLNDCTVIAPISGTVADNTLSVGAYVSGQAAPVVLTTIYDNSSVTATFSIEDERYQELLNMQASTDSLSLDKVPVTFEQQLPHQYTGEITYMAPALNKSTGTLLLKCKIDNTYDELRAGMYVKINLPYKRLPDAILVKDAAIGSDQAGKYLYVVNDSNKVVYTPVVTGDLYQDSLRIITKGIAPTDRYVTKALLKVRNGMTVSPQTEK